MDKTVNSHALEQLSGLCGTETCMPVLDHNKLLKISICSNLSHQPRLSEYARNPTYSAAYK